MRKDWKWKNAQRLELWWWKRYLRGQSPEDYRAWKRQYWQDFLKALPESLIQPGRRMLDTGCGPAGIFMALEECDVTAFDPLMDAYRDQLEVFSRELYPYCQFHKATLEDGLPGTWPVVFCTNAINHVNNWEKAMGKLADMVEDNGWLILTSDVHKGKWTRQVFRWIPGDLLHPQQHIAPEYQDVLKEKGFVIHSERIIKPGRVFNYWQVVAQKNPATW